MQIVIDIPKGFYEHVKGHKDIFTYGLNGEKIGEIIANGTVLPDNPTNGDVIKAMYPNQNSSGGDIVALLDLDGFVVTTFPKKWWNALYREKVKE